MIPEGVTSKCLQALKKALKEKRITYRELATRLGVSEVSVKRRLNNPELSLEKLLAIAQCADVNVAELIANAQAKPTFSYYSKTQDRAFYLNPHLHSYFDQLFIKRKTTKEIKREFALSESSTYLYLRKLEELELIEILPSGDVNILVSAPIGFSRTSLVLRASIKEKFAETCDAVFNNNREGYVMLVRELQLDQTSYNHMAGELSHLVAKYDKISGMGNASDERYRIAMFANPLATISETDSPNNIPKNITNFEN